MIRSGSSGCAVTEGQFLEHPRSPSVIPPYSGRRAKLFGVMTTLKVPLTAWNLVPASYLSLLHIDDVIFQGLDCNISSTGERIAQSVKPRSTVSNLPQMIEKRWHACRCVLLPGSCTFQRLNTVIRPARERTLDMVCHINEPPKSVIHKIG